MPCPQATLSATHHRFGRAPPALSQMAFCQLRSLRLPRSSPFAAFWSVASLLTLPRRPSYQSPLHLWMPLRKLFRRPLLSGHFYALHLRLLTYAACVCSTSPRCLLMRLLQTPLWSVASHDASTQLPITEFFIGCIFSNDPSDHQASPSAHCNAGSASLQNPLTLLRFAAPAVPVMSVTVTSTLRAHTSH